MSHSNTVVARIQPRKPEPKAPTFDNKFQVKARGAQVFIMHPQSGSALEREDVLNLAAWLVVVGDITGEELGDAISAIRGEEPAPAADGSSS